MVKDISIRDKKKYWDEMLFYRKDIKNQNGIGFHSEKYIKKIEISYIIGVIKSLIL